MAKKKKPFDKKNYDANYYQQKAADRNEVGKLPEVKYPAIRERALADLEFFLTYFFGEDVEGETPGQEIFIDPFGEVQKASIKQEQAALERGAGKLNKLEPRAYGKSTRSILSSVWSVLKGCQTFVLICCDSQTKATNLLKIAQMAIGDNKKLLECFPELKCFHHLKGNPHRAQYQTFEGEPTDISIKGDSIWFPKLHGFDSSEAIIRVCPFLKARGTNIKGRRPSIVILDDIQSTEDAINPNTVKKLIAVLKGDISLLGTRRKPVAIINNATIIAAHDFPSQLAAMRAFTTVRYKMVNSLPTDDRLWDRYHEIREAYDPDDPDDKDRAKRDALAFYVEYRGLMDLGSSVTWDFAFSHDPADYEVSTIQAAMNFIRDFGMEAFLSECQNESPEPEPEDEVIGPEFYATKTSDYRRDEIPDWTTRRTIAVDVGDYNLHWIHVGWSPGFRGQVIDYGVYVVGNTPDMKPKTKEIQLKSALCWFRDEVLNEREFDLCYIDAGYLATDVIYPFCRHSNDSRIKPCMGAGDRNAPKDLRNFRIPKKKGKGLRPGYFQAERLVKKGVWLNWLDSDHWKRFVRDRFNTQADDVSGSLRLFQTDRRDYGDHEAFGLHMVNEWWDVDRRAWKQKTRNHWSDAIYYAAAAAGRLGCRVGKSGKTTTRRRTRRGIEASF